jgi:hypothetical protein
MRHRSRADWDHDRTKLMLLSRLKRTATSDGAEP